MLTSSQKGILMRYLMFAAALAATALSPASGVSHAQTAGAIEITVENVRHHDGVIRAELRTEQTWRKGRRAAGIDVPVPASGPVVLSFTGVPAGRYGVRLFQDRNKDGEMQTNFIGLPTEPWGISNNAPVRMSLPDFSAAAFTVQEGQTSRQSIRLR
jgi:uncharacterized protein (DUF2141 family)